LLERHWLRESRSFISCVNQLSLDQGQPDSFDGIELQFRISSAADAPRIIDGLRRAGFAGGWLRYL
jgi:hypothetical protein